VIEAIRWDGAALHLLDQRRLPTDEVWLRLDTLDAVARAIADMVVRGAPAIAISGAYGLVLGERAGLSRAEGSRRLLAARPTAVNLRWAMERMRDVVRLEDEAIAIHREDRALNEALGAHGAALLDGGVLTICNTGSLATGGHGTALGMVRSARALGKPIHLFALETRPYLQGARLTAWECAKDGIPCTLLADGAAGVLLRSGRVRQVVVGCDRVARNGDTANKLGTYGLAVLARAHDVPFYVAMPTPTLDRTLATGETIPIEERAPGELTTIAGTRMVAEGVEVMNPAFDVTPAALVAGWVTERGVWRPPFPPAGRLPRPLEVP
jgi:methylthioribose-1-phosphate isomerase